MLSSLISLCFAASFKENVDGTAELFLNGTASEFKLLFGLYKSSKDDLISKKWLKANYKDMHSSLKKLLEVSISEGNNDNQEVFDTIKDLSDIDALVFIGGSSNASNQL